MPLLPRPATAPELAKPTPPPWHSRADAIALAVVLLGLLVRLISLGDGLWYDEIRTLVEYARRPLGDIVTTYDNQNQHVFYSVLARLSFLTLGESATALRLPAVFLGAGSLWALYGFGKRTAGTLEALLATALLATSYHHIWFSQNARGYTGLLFFILVGTSALHRLLIEEQPGRGAVACYTVAMALAAYTHVTAVLVSVVHAGVVGVAWWGARKRAPGAGWTPALALGFSALVGAVLYSPLLLQLASTPFKPGTETVASEWQQPSWFVLELIRGLAAGLPGGWVGLAVVMLVGGAGLVSIARGSLALAALLILPGLLTAAVAIGLGHNLRPRFLFFSAGFGLIVAVRGSFVLARALWPQYGERLAVGLLLAAVVTSAARAPSAYGPKQDFEAAARYVDRHAAPEDAVATVDLTAYPYQVYAARAWPELTSIGDLDAMERGHARTWVLYTFPISIASVQPEIWQRLHTSYDTASVFPGTVNGGEIVVMVSRGPDDNSEKPR